MSFYGIPQFAANVATTIAGVTLLGTSANAAVILAETVRRFVVEGYKLATGAKEEAKPKATIQKEKTVLSYVKLFPYSSSDKETLCVSLFASVALGTAAFVLANRFCPSLVTNTNGLLNYVAPIQFGPNYLTNRIGL